jgi:Ca-activated chloride channel homolog
MRADFSLDYDVLTFEKPQKLYLMARFASGAEAADRPRRPLNLSLVVDRSGSMAGAKIDYTRQAAQFLVQHLGARDVFSIVLYNDKIETLLQPEIVSNKDTVNHLIEQIRVMGTTNLSGGWLEGVRHVAGKLSKEYLNRVILMSDGLANRGVTDPYQLVNMAKQKREEGVSTTTMGLGDEFNEDLMMAMANAGGGAYYFIESPEVAPTIFAEELSGLLNVIGQNLAITLVPTEHVKLVTQLNAYPVVMDGKQTTFQLGDIFSDEVKTLVLELSIPALQNIGETKIAQLRFEYDEITGERSQHHLSEMDVMVNIRPAGEAPRLADPDVEQSVLLLKAAQARQDAVKSADKGNYNSASMTLRQVAEAIDKAGVKNDQLREERDALLTQAQQMDRGSQQYDEYSRKTMATQAFYTMTSRHSDTVMLRFREQLRKQSDDAINKATQETGSIDKQPGVTPTHLGYKDQVWELKGDIMRVGRASHNEIVINEKGVSRFHCQIKREGDKLMLEDVGSTNGTTLAGERITTPHALSVGDEIYLCDEKLIFQLKKSEA